MQNYPVAYTALAEETGSETRSPGKRLAVVVVLFVILVTGLLGFAYWYWNQSKEDLVVLNLRIEETRHQQLLLQQ